MNLSSKSISKVKVDGSIEIYLSPSINLISLLILIILIGDSLTTNPELIIFSINSFADPSKIGTSSLSISIKALSIPNPNNAPIKCSIVETLTPKSLDIVVLSEVLVTFAKLGNIKLLFFKSTLLNTIPVLGSEGFIEILTIWPLWRPIPVNFTGSLILGHQTTGTLDAAQYNTGVGLAALDAITAGDNNTAIGNNALSDNTTGSDNIAIGYNALADNTTLGSNIAIGRNALAAQTSGGEFNVAVGSYSLDENTFGDKNVALGYVALGKNTEAGNNTGIGAEALKLNTTGTYHTGLGSAAGDALGTGSQNVLIGASTDPSAADATNQTVIGYNSTGQADNSVTLGNADVTAVYMAQDKGATVHAAGISLENDETITNTTDGTLILNGEVAAGTGSATGIFKSNGDYDVTLKTGNSTTGSITITDGANGNVTIAPDGTGKTDFNDSPLTGFGADISAESGTSKTLAATDNGTIINCSSGSAITITVPTSLPTGFNCMIIQSGSGQVTLSASSTTLNNRNGLKTTGQHAIMTLVHLGSNVFWVSGDTSSS